MIKNAGIKNGADDGNRTHDLILTKDVLYRLSYISALFGLFRRMYYTIWDSRFQGY